MIIAKAIPVAQVLSRRKRHEAQQSQESATQHLDGSGCRGRLKVSQSLRRFSRAFSRDGVLGLLVGG